MAAYYRPNTLQRQAALNPTTAAICFIDTQNYNCSKEGACYTSLSEDEQQVGAACLLPARVFHAGPPRGVVPPPLLTAHCLLLTPQSEAYYFSALAEAIPRWQKLQAAFRGAGSEVCYTVIQSLTPDGRDRSLDYKISGFHVPPGCFDAKVLQEIAPLGNEIVLPKTSSSVFNSTVLHYVLRNMGVTQLVLCGCVTDQCVEHAVRDACDLGYLVTMVTGEICVWRICHLGRVVAWWRQLNRHTAFSLSFLA